MRTLLFGAWALVGSQMVAAAQDATLCDRYLSHEEYEQAIPCFETVLRINPQLAGAFTGLGMAYARKKQFDKAIQNFSEAIRLAPNNAWAYNFRGFAFKDTGKREDAIRDFRKALALNPDLNSSRVALVDLGIYVVPPQHSGPRPPQIAQSRSPAPVSELTRNAAAALIRPAVDGISLQAEIRLGWLFKSDIYPSYAGLFNNGVLKSGDCRILNEYITVCLVSLSEVGRKYIDNRFSVWGSLLARCNSSCEQVYLKVAEFRFGQVTGIIDVAPNQKNAEYSFTKSLTPVAVMLEPFQVNSLTNTIGLNQAIFLKYDDGWRLANEKGLPAWAR